MTMRSLLFSPGTDYFESTVLVFQYTTVTLWLIQSVSSLFRKLRLAPIHKIKAKHLNLAFKVLKKKKKKRNPKKGPYSSCNPSHHPAALERGNYLSCL